MCPLSGGAQQLVKMPKGGLGHAGLVGEHDVAIKERINPALLLAVCTLAVEKSRVGVSVFEPSDPRSLAGDGSLKGCQDEVGDLELLVKPRLMVG